MTGNPSELYDAIGEEFDVTKSLHWSYIFDHVTSRKVNPLLAALAGIGFGDPEVYDDQDEPGGKLIWFTEECVYTKESFLARLRGLESLAKTHGVQLSDCSAGDE